MLCGECKYGFYGQMFTSDKCANCGEEIVTPHIPCYILCDKCSLILKQCKQCGLTID